MPSQIGSSPAPKSDPGFPKGESAPAEPVVVLLVSASR